MPREWVPTPLWKCLYTFIFTSSGRIVWKLDHLQDPCQFREYVEPYTIPSDYRR